MKSHQLAIILGALGAIALAVPALAEAPLPPPYGPVGISVANPQQALADLHRRGLTDIHGLGLIGDYWEGEGLLHGRRVVAYLFENGTLRLHRYPRTELMQAFGNQPRPFG